MAQCNTAQSPNVTLMEIFIYYRTRFTIQGVKMAKLQERRGQYHLNLPIALVKSQNWNKGEVFSFTPLEDGRIAMAQVKAYV